MTDTTQTPPTLSRASFVGLCAWVAIAACGVSAIAVLIADATVAGNDMVADTISAMAAGPKMWLAEIGIYAIAFAFMIIALGAAAAHPGGWAWSGATLGFVALGVIIFIIGFRDEYGDGDQMASEVVHTKLVYTLAVVLAVSTWLASQGGKLIDKSIAGHLAILTLLWVVSAPIFVFLPTGYDGIYERFLGAIMIVIVVSVSRLLLLQGEPLKRIVS